MSKRRKCERILKDGRECGKPFDSRYDGYCPSCKKAISKSHVTDGNYIYDGGGDLDQLTSAFPPPISLKELEKGIKRQDQEFLDGLDDYPL